MRAVEPKVRLIARPSIIWDEVRAYLEEVGGLEWLDRILKGEQPNDGESLVEFCGRLCYRSWAPGLNANVTKVREDSEVYLANILASLHGSVIEHANYTFILQDVSRVFTHELVRHRAGAAYSQESMRFVRLTDIPQWMPGWAQEDPRLMERNTHILAILEEHQTWMADHFGLDATKDCDACSGRGSLPGYSSAPEQFPPDPIPCQKCGQTGQVAAVPFSEKKGKTSFMRRFAPDGVATSIVATYNIRSLRWIIQQRTEPGAEEEIRLVFDKVGQIMQKEAPALFQDFERDLLGQWTPTYRKV